MKRLLSLIAFLFLLTAMASGQGNGNNGNAYGQGGGNSNWSGANWPGWLQNWLQNGGQVPQPLALAAIWKARDWGWANFRLHYGQMVAKYAQGQLTVTYVSTAPPTLTFAVTYGGLGTIVIIDDF